MENFLKVTEPKLQLALNATSLICAITVIALLGLMAFLYRDLFDRVSIRFQGLIAIVDVVRHGNVFIYGNAKGALCTISGFISVFGDPLYIFFGVAVAANLHVFGIRNMIPSTKLQVWMLVSISAILFVMTLGAYGFGAIGEDMQGNCALIEDRPYSWLSRILLVYLPIIPGILYCLYVFVTLICKYRPKNDSFQESINYKISVPKDSRVTITNFVKKLYLRIALIPLFCAVNLMFYIIVNLVREVWDFEKNALSVLSRSGLRLAGLLNLISLVLDPYFHIAVQRFINKNNDDILSINAEKGFSLTEGTYYDHDGYYVNDPDYIPDKEDLELLEHYKNLKLA